MVGLIPKGHVATYGQIAALAGYPRNSRQVGSLMRSLPANSKVPWHRVISSSGQISIRPNSDSMELQAKRLKSEGVEISETGRIDLRQFRWTP